MCKVITKISTNLANYDDFKISNNMEKRNVPLIVSSTSAALISSLTLRVTVQSLFLS